MPIVGLFGMLQVCLGQRPTGELDKRDRDIEGWILGRESEADGSCATRKAIAYSTTFQPSRSPGRCRSHFR
jgi:hypothetical protein